MNFISKLKSVNDTVLSSVLQSDEELTLRAFNHIHINDELRISIQASYGHYCSPRKTFKDLSKYKLMEFALIGSDGAFLSVSDILPKFPKLNEIEEYYDTVYGFVPVELIEELYQCLINT